MEEAGQGVSAVSRGYPHPAAWHTDPSFPAFATPSTIKLSTLERTIASGQGEILFAAHLSSPPEDVCGKCLEDLCSISALAQPLSDVSVSLHQEGVLRTGLSQGGLVYYFSFLSLCYLPSGCLLRSQMKTHLKTKVRITNSSLFPSRDSKGNSREKDRMSVGSCRCVFCMCVFKLLHWSLWDVKWSLSSVRLLGLSWWCQLHTGQVRRLGNTNGSMKAQSTDPDTVTWILSNHFAESHLDKREAQRTQSVLIQQLN